MFPQAKIHIFGFIVVVAVFKKRHLLKVIMNKRTETQTDGQTDHGGSVHGLTFPSLVRSTGLKAPTN